MPHLENHEEKTKNRVVIKFSECVYVRVLGKIENFGLLHKGF